MTDLALSSLTDVILACELLFLAGLAFRTDVESGSPAWLWAIYLTVSGIATALGAIDHGFFEPIDHPGHGAMKFATRATLAVGAVILLLTSARQFLSSLWTRVVVAAGLVALAATLWVNWTSDDLLAVVAMNAVGMLLALVLHLFNLRTGRGSSMMCVGIVLSIAASSLVFSGGNGFFGLGLYGTMHVALMPAALALFLGGLKLRRTRSGEAPA
ncbi:hypothetical protein T8K17_06490 [Thalassobaculum sp. OXR-137]|uniref:DUF6962 family protein n=1 Tax=Thalassobaculum sp. OXR-137 TaxID=3100173 RepID=UPI002AC9488C|nr:hypothetical protein [Thalassobaculum sp. OXR-137]WPZ35787.1 hypothetical protein T8K17_06490 [Thalassobaculum sp. OXR-137]